MYVYIAIQSTLATVIPPKAFDLIADLKTKNDYAVAKSLLLRKCGSSEEERIQGVGDLLSGEANDLSAIQVASLERSLLDNKVIKDPILSSIICEISVCIVHPSKKALARYFLYALPGLIFINHSINGKNEVANYPFHHIIDFLMIEIILLFYLHSSYGAYSIVKVHLNSTLFSTLQNDCVDSPYGPSSCAEKDLNRIIGGRNALIHELPWQAYIRIQIAPKIYSECGGSLISTKYILTAAHCFIGVPTISLNDVQVTLGDHILYSNEDGITPEILDVDKIILHSFQLANVTKDIALLRLERRVNISDDIGPICLPSLGKYQSFEHFNSVASGWGRTGVHSQPSSVLKRTELEILPNDHPYCCSNGTSLENRKCTLIGIVSYGPDACVSDSEASVYTRVSHYLFWIRENMEKESKSCDLSCTPLGASTGIYRVNDHKVQCQNGVCSSLDSGEDSCYQLEHPCSHQDPLHCGPELQYNSKHILMGMIRTQESASILKLKFGSLWVECNSKTGNCCSLDSPSKNLRDLIIVEIEESSKVFY
ncbi:unnamed protein product [Lepeophtheirus salmonis]|uniref:(salmon louse) hypothetical protein n=1 Tax=Lepeophtheirus salmonis TaxID=72036 RepID=A0A7R8CHL4_LEPSM|nr:unnamed protein product [Lepeophtheirus salmonis]CAF2768953.1 unnamed protein product [Lepeophtheirus salmonis]